MGDAALAQQLATAFEAVAPVGDQVFGALACSARATRGACQPYSVEEPPKLRAAVALGEGHDHRERAALAVAGEVHLRRETAPAAPQGLVFGVQEPPFASSLAGLRLAPAACW